MTSPTPASSAHRPPPRVIALALSTHPGPTMAVTVVTAGLAVGAGLEPWRIIMLAAAMLFGQASVGLSNDWLDAARDRETGRSDKPIARGWITEPAVRNVAGAAAVGALVLTVPLGVPATIAHLVFIASAWAYNLGLKSTAASVLPYIVSFGLLPELVTLSLARPLHAAPWAIVVGAALGVAAHFANVLPDLDDDEASGVRGLPHRLGVRIATIGIWAVLAFASVVVLIGPRGTISWLQWAGFALSALIMAMGIVITAGRPPSRTAFRLIMAAALVDVALLVLAGERIVA